MTTTKAQYQKDIAEIRQAYNAVKEQIQLELPYIQFGVSEPMYTYICERFNIEKRFFEECIVQPADGPFWCSVVLANLHDILKTVHSLRRS